MNRQQRREKKTAGKSNSQPAGQNAVSPLLGRLTEMFAHAERLHATGRMDEAEVLYRQIHALDPAHASSLHQLGVLCFQTGRHQLALDLINQAIALSGGVALFYLNLGTVLQGVGRLAEAAAAFERALAIKPDFLVAFFNLGNVFQDQGKLPDAIACYERALLIKPDFPQALHNLGNALQLQGKLTEATVFYARALAIAPASPELLNNAANALQAQGKLSEAISMYERALTVKPDYALALSNLLMTMHYSARFSGANIAHCARRVADQYPVSAQRRQFDNLPIPRRRLRLGYVSGDFINHPVGYFLAKVLPAHDRQAVEVFCYSNKPGEDEMTERLRRSADHWRSVVGLSDAEVARMIGVDAIDILVDLSGHTRRNRLGVFALRAAPVQVCWLGYFGTTGLPTMDYVLADRHVVPESAEQDFTETIWRLPDSYLCFSPPDLDVAVGQLPSASGAPLTFGCFSNHVKTTPETIALWARVLNSLPQASLLLKNRSLADPGVRQELLNQLAGHGIAAERIVIEGLSSRLAYLETYRRIDIVLDTTPFSGGTTTAEALWMGVPVVTLRGPTWAGRICESILATVGLPELVATTAEAYVEIATRLAHDLPRLTSLRSGLRGQLASSPFCDSARFTRQLEDAYAGMWRIWCEQH